LSALSLLAKARDRGIELVADGGRLRYRAPWGVLTPDLRAALAARKGELLAVLGGERQQFHQQGDCRSPWPESLPGRGPRRIDCYARCEICGRGTWVRYGGTARCLGCALAARGDSRGHQALASEG